MYDVIVIGAGPAGSACAYYLAKEGVSVLLLDKEDFPRDKACGDAIMPPAIQELQILGIGEQLEARYHKVSHVTRIVQGKTMRNGIEPYGWVIPRIQFDALLHKHACEQQACEWQGGVTVLEYAYDATSIWVYGIDKNKQRRQYRAQLVIAADGSRSRIATQMKKQMAQRREWDAIPFPVERFEQTGCFTARRGYFEHIDHAEETLAFYFPLDQSLHYAWIFPLGEGKGTNVGWIATPSQTRRQKGALQQLDRYAIQGHPEAKLRGKWLSAPIAAGLRNTALYADRILAIGDAASLVHPLTAEGISGALWSARQASIVARASFQKGDFSSDLLQEYGLVVKQRYLAAYTEATGQLQY